MRNADLYQTIEVLPIAELVDLKKRIEKMLSERSELRRLEALEALRAVAQEHGFSLFDLIGSQTLEAGGGEVLENEKVYVHPDNPSLFWRGKGRHPIWFKQLLRKGISPDSLLRRL